MSTPVEWPDEFTECSNCRHEPGSPTLCLSCLCNRQLISRLQARVKELESLMQDDAQWFFGSFQRHSGNLVDVIAASCGWLPLANGEKMTVHYDGKAYVIQRKGD